MSPDLDLLAQPLAEYKGFGPVTCERLAERGVVTVEDLLWHRPIRYQDRRQISSIQDIDAVGPRTLVGQVRSVSSGWRGRRNAPSTAVVHDSSGSIQAVWFNRPYLSRQVDPDKTYVLHGEVRAYEQSLQLTNPTLEPILEGDDPRRIVPVYPSLGDLGQSRVRTLVRKLLEQVDFDQVKETLDPSLLDRYRLAALGPALAAIHQPGTRTGSLALTERGAPPSRRLAFGELLELQIALQRKRGARAAVIKPRAYEGIARVPELLEKMLPFSLTGSQRQVLKEIWTDLGSSKPMSRLVQGDVGCGKTVVALGAILAAIESGLQAAFMVPTEILAEQHWSTIEKWMPPHIGVELLTSSSDLAGARARLESGQSGVAIGTHALIQESTEFARLGLVIVDEQHRFGVDQRRALADKGENVDLLVMTATPIPRSLTLALYGDLDLSVIDELPKGRLPVVTEIVPASDAQPVVDAVHREIECGGRVFVVFPAISTDQERGVSSLEEHGIRWLQRLQPIACALLSGKTPAAEREIILARFASGETPVLLTTTVIEVGVDIPQAGLLVIDGADRFGLSQLHQLRGRVGRGDRGGLCLAVQRSHSGSAAERLEVFASTSDGFAIADADLRLRGPGELLGSRQAGIANLRAASLVTDLDLLEAAREEARHIVAEGGGS